MHLNSNVSCNRDGESTCGRNEDASSAIYVDVLPTAKAQSLHAFFDARMMHIRPVVEFEYLVHGILNLVHLRIIAVELSAHVATVQRVTP